MFLRISSNSFFISPKDLGTFLNLARVTVRFMAVDGCIVRCTEIRTELIHVKFSEFENCILATTNLSKSLVSFFPHNMSLSLSIPSTVLSRTSPVWRLCCSRQGGSLASDKNAQLLPGATCPFVKKIYLSMVIRRACNIIRDSTHSKH